MEVRLLSEHIAITKKAGMPLDTASERLRTLIDGNLRPKEETKIFEKVFERADDVLKQF